MTRTHVSCISCCVYQRSDLESASAFLLFCNSFVRSISLRKPSFGLLTQIIPQVQVQERAIERMLDELTTQGTHDDRDNLTRSYHRRAAKALIDQIGATIADDKQDTAVKLIEKLRQRHNTFGRRWSA